MLCEKLNLIVECTALFDFVEILNSVYRPIRRAQRSNYLTTIAAKLHVRGGGRVASTV